MRTYDKLIATIPARQGTGILRPHLGGRVTRRQAPGIDTPQGLHRSLKQAFRQP